MLVVWGGFFFKIWWGDGGFLKLFSPWFFEGEINGGWNRGNVVGCLVVLCFGRLVVEGCGRLMGGFFWGGGEGKREGKGGYRKTKGRVGRIENTEVSEGGGL